MLCAKLLAAMVTVALGPTQMPAPLYFACASPNPQTNRPGACLLCQAGVHAFGVGRRSLHEMRQIGREAGGRGRGTPLEARRHTHTYRVAHEAAVRDGHPNSRRRNVDAGAVVRLHLPRPAQPAIGPYCAPPSRTFSNTSE